ncbi:MULTISPECIES: bifunctional riboflavin kinase/FAD synthetase [unclassified Methylophaga]|jgi:riboflavin kinase/FMN adenylyltransferase|uniref:bifunctional riboflavin kinase/FAD synthetase n=1 Tax=unclassified Methylophaga TaxID=2629249 RepID=UPI000C8FB03F|nr:MULTISPECIES: bifunctional riboflavin kinase/FAD synthetase [unclassified Methylophaga]MAK67084.1 bifunctional riboflavin kinase/FMN adenylyltransferase [Methylophaga sp.]MAY18122.1 bifunctional riboflavin kinase/FMN adenylyltransferase [Methylophaga sp.]HAO24593.1 bifunctional riboflavin kinase/FAD synthetase [Methylophaga sp.]HCD04424.1 bifunctional riboflavin kinase/FAD synthetase [Methylophaga sp.]|tara:strand:+ start:29742 stop:30686 length:945 start_codon:yes stop_codon:yes gene_type:complete
MPKIFRGLYNLPDPAQGCVATIGNFDGVHLGHQAVLTQLAMKADMLNLPAVVITFEPQPFEYFVPGKAPARLSRFREKVEALRAYSIQKLCVLRFNRQLAEMQAETFIQKLLVEGLNVRYLVVGDDFRFGKDRQGDFNLLQQVGKNQGFQVVNMHTFAIDAMRVSSTRIRDALREGDLSVAEKLLGRPYRMSGRVAHGDKRGRKMGYPTANIHLHRAKVPLNGVYAVQLYGIDEEPVNGVANIGVRPTISGSDKALLEVHLFDFQRDIYGEHVQVYFLKKLRDEQKFASLEKLIEQIHFDSAQAKDYFESHIEL